MIKAYPTKWEIIDEEAGLDVGIIKGFDEYALTLTVDDKIMSSEELFQIAQIFRQVEGIYKKGLSGQLSEKEKNT